MDYDDLVKYLLDIREEEAADAITKLRAERDALLEQRRHLLDTNLMARASVQIQKELNTITTERDALRALLREARAALPDMRHNELLRAKLDAALAGKDAP